MCVCAIFSVFLLQVLVNKDEYILLFISFLSYLFVFVEM